ncbi:uncharacterized protein PFL1_06274 [Pseudozyma flocculosa PF-1]|uniref:Related to bifunctional 4-hydroxyphenylacetate degradation enzyme n=2 Tax=Pseudozyma flocculosa TaxID=84751 RepID=A0A5C3FAI6_9BASI|nr:uncharacterized protein PFL1_06274 [Pseudozyma flocculosa PF-1]EPQ26066.1 hypothetical protein PFL1_06274 [Pseudozyma flocculosa PF-1]SPO40309.1 related to bifunctional 4-hydroxyphenylacetate degradation enzyme [Pseudozyma flocculosa]
MQRRKADKPSSDASAAKAARREEVQCAHCEEKPGTLTYKSYLDGKVEVCNECHDFLTKPYSRVVRFDPASTTQVCYGVPADPDQDIGLAIARGETVLIDTLSGPSLFELGDRFGGHRESADVILSPLDEDEIGAIRCIGLNYKNHAEECNLPIPTVPTLFLKGENALASPYPAETTVVPKAFVKDDAADYESEIAIIIGKHCKDVSEEEAMDYVFGITAANDISSRKAQFAQSQWCFSKSFDGACPVGPCVVLRSAIDDWAKVKVTGTHNGKVVQESTLDDLIFSIPKIVSVLSQGTTLRPGTLILTGTPAGVGWMQEPKNTLQDGDEFHVSVSHGVGTLVSKIEFEK